MKKKLLILFACLLFVTGCKDVKLENGGNAIVTFEEGGISSDDLYNELKNQYGAETLTNLIDKYLLAKKYKETKEEKDYIKQMINSLESAATSAGTNLQTYISAYYGLKDKDALKDYLSLSYRRDQWKNDYAKETVTDKQIKQYYDGYVYGDVDASQILITIDAATDASDDEKTKAETEALNKAKEVIKKLKAGEDFAKLAKEYSKDASSSSNGGSLGKVNDGDLADEALTALRELKDGSYTTTPVKSSYGYHILYRTSMEDKPELTDELKKTIISKVAEEIAAEDGFSAKALKALREQNKMKFVDTTLESEFNDLNN